MAVSQLSPAEILGKIRYDPLTKKGSVYDVIRLVTGYAQKDITHEYRAIAGKFPDVLGKVQDFKFPGQGQRLTPVAHLSTLIEIAWLCPGRHAKEFRRTGAVTLCRALGGDLSLVEEIKKRHADVSEEEQAAFLEGTGVTAAEANGQALQERSVSLEERLVALEERRVGVQKRKLEILEHAADMLRSMAEREADARHRLFLEDSSKNAVVMYASLATGKRLAIEGGGDGADEPVTIAEVAGALGLDVARQDLARLGRAVARAYREAHGGEEPPKHKQFVDGAVRLVNSYFHKDRALIEAAVRACYE